MIDRITRAHEQPIVVQEMALAVESSAAKLEHRAYAFYDPEDRRDPPQHKLMAELHQAIVKGELELREWLLGKRRTGLEPATSSLGSSRSTS